MASELFLSVFFTFPLSQNEYFFYFHFAVFFVLQNNLNNNYKQNT